MSEKEAPARGCLIGMLVSLAFWALVVVAIVWWVHR
jgi:glycerol-3-phosphate acyltransferase PlsY